MLTRMSTCADPTVNLPTIAWQNSNNRSEIRLGIHDVRGKDKKVVREKDEGIVETVENLFAKKAQISAGHSDNRWMATNIAKATGIPIRASPKKATSVRTKTALIRQFPSGYSARRSRHMGS